MANFELGSHMLRQAQRDDLQRRYNRQTSDTMRLLTDRMPDEKQSKA